MDVIDFKAFLALGASYTTNKKTLDHSNESTYFKKLDEMRRGLNTDTFKDKKFPSEFKFTSIATDKHNFFTLCCLQRNKVRYVKYLVRKHPQLIRDNEEIIPTMLEYLQAGYISYADHADLMRFLIERGATVDETSRTKLKILATRDISILYELRNSARQEQPSGIEEFINWRITRGEPISLSTVFMTAYKAITTPHFLNAEPASKTDSTFDIAAFTDALKDALRTGDCTDLRAKINNTPVLPRDRKDLTDDLKQHHKAIQKTIISCFKGRAGLRATPEMLEILASRDLDLSVLLANPWIRMFGSRELKDYVKKDCNLRPDSIDLLYDISSLKSSTRTR